MAITGSQQAPLEAMAGTARVGATRVGYFDQSRMSIHIPSVADLSKYLVKSSLTISFQKAGVPATARFTLRGGYGVAIREGMQIQIGHGSIGNVLFHGWARRVTRRLPRHIDKHPEYDIECLDWTWALGHARVMFGYVAPTSTSATSVLYAMLDATSPAVGDMSINYKPFDGFPGYANSLPGVESFEVSPLDDLVGAIERLMRTVGATWYIDERRNLHAYVTSDPGMRTPPTTVVPGAAGYWGVQRTTDLSRVFTAVTLRGARTTTVFDSTTEQVKAPIRSAYALSRAPIQTPFPPSSDYGPLLFGTEVRSGLTGLYTAGAYIQAPQISVLQSVDVGASTVVLVCESNTINTIPILSQNWITIAGQPIYLVGRSALPYSTAGNSIAWSYLLPTSGPGAVISAIGSLTTIAGVDQVRWYSSLSPTRLIPAGTDVSLYYAQTNSTAVNQVRTLTAGSLSGVIPRTFDVPEQYRAQMWAFATDALTRGAPDQWTTLRYMTTDRHVRLGAMVPFALTAPGEASGPTITGHWQVQQLTIDDFAHAAGPSRGPRRTVVLGPVRPPTLFDVLRDL